MSFFKDLKEDIAQSVNELTESLDEIWQWMMRKQKRQFR